MILIQVSNFFMHYCSFTRKLLVAVVDTWDGHVHIIDKVVPPNWKVWIALANSILCSCFNVFRTVMVIIL